MLEMLDHTIRIGSTPTFLYFVLYLYSSACYAHTTYVYIIYIYVVLYECIILLQCYHHHHT